VLGLVGVWTENRLVVSTQAVSVSLLEIGWIIDFIAGLLRGGETPFGIAAYMFDPVLPLFVRLLSLYHLVLPWFLLWLAWRLGYDRRAWWIWMLAGWGILLLAFLVPGERNVNWVYGIGSDEILLLPQPWWLVTVMAGCALAWLLTHLAITALTRWWPASHEAP